MDAGKLTSSSGPPRLVLRMNAIIEAVEPGFELFGSKFQWYGFLHGRCGFTIDEYKLCPPGCPPVPSDYEGDGLSLQSLVGFSLAVARGNAFSSFIRDYIEDLNMKINARQAMRAIISSTLARDREGIQFGEDYPSSLDAAFEDYDFTGKARSALRLDSTGRANLSLKVERPYLASWIKTLEASIDAGRRVEIGLRYHIERSDDTDLDNAIRSLVSGASTILGGAFAVRGFSLAGVSENLVEAECRKQKPY